MTPNTDTTRVETDAEIARENGGETGGANIFGTGTVLDAPAVVETETVRTTETVRSDTDALHDAPGPSHIEPGVTVVERVGNVERRGAPIVRTRPHDPLAEALVRASNVPATVAPKELEVKGPGPYRIDYVNDGTEYNESFDTIPHAVQRVASLKRAGINALAYTA